MTSDEIRAILQDIMRMISTSPVDLDKIYTYYADDLFFSRPPFPAVEGIAANKAADEAMYAAFTDNHVELHDIIVEGDIAAMHYTWSATHTGVSPSLGIPPTFKRFDAESCDFCYFRDGKIYKQIQYFDLFGMLQKLGVIPAPA